MLKTIDLFAGAGGLSYGFMMTGNFKILAAAEINENARKTYKKNIANSTDNFVFIDNVIGYDFSKLNQELDGIDVVIGGPPCQGFSNANRQKNHLISLNNGLVKEYFRAIKEIRPKAFVMENVSMLKSDTHRFYESTRDNSEIEELVNKGFSIPKRKERIIITTCNFEGVDFSVPSEIEKQGITLPQDLVHLLGVLKKNLSNSRRLPNYLQKNSSRIVKRINEVIDGSTSKTEGYKVLERKLIGVREALLTGTLERLNDSLDYIVGLQKAVKSIQEIQQNGLIGSFDYSEEGLSFYVYSYSVIDYINAILGDDYVQKEGTINSEWFGVPQERRRFIVMGLRRDVFESSKDDFELPQRPEGLVETTVAEAIDDLVSYEVGYTPDYRPIEYKPNYNLSEYAKQMRLNSQTVSNHITTKTRQVAMERFKKIKPGNNFHSLDSDDKKTYAKPERTQNTIYLRLDPNKPSGTVVNVRKSMWIHPYLDRAISVREAARLQSFPDCFVFEGTKDSQYQQVGNAVPPLMARGIAETLIIHI